MNRTRKKKKCSFFDFDFSIAFSPCYTSCLAEDFRFQEQVLEDLVVAKCQANRRNRYVHKRPSWGSLEWVPPFETTKRRGGRGALWSSLGGRCVGVHPRIWIMEVSRILSFETFGKNECYISCLRMWLRCFRNLWWTWIYVQVDTTRLYEILGLEKSATPQQIKKAYLKLARKVGWMKISGLIIGWRFTNMCSVCDHRNILTKEVTQNDSKKFNMLMIF